MTYSIHETNGELYDSIKKACKQFYHEHNVFPEYIEVSPEQKIEEILIIFQEPKLKPRIELPWLDEDASVPYKILGGCKIVRIKLIGDVELNKFYMYDHSIGRVNGLEYYKRYKDTNK